MPSARGRQASKKKATVKRRAARKRLPIVPAQEVIRVVPLPDPDFLVEAPIAPEPPPPPRTVRAAGVSHYPETWSEVDRNNIIHQVCLRLDRNIERVQNAEDSVKNVAFVTAGIVFIFILFFFVLIQINRQELADQTKRLKNAEHKIKILMTTAVEKAPTFQTVSSNGNVTGTNNVFIGYKVTE